MASTDPSPTTHVQEKDILTLPPAADKDGGDEDMAESLPHLQRITVAAGEAVLREGEPSAGLMVVQTGRLRVRLLIDGRPVFVGEFGPGAVLGEVSWMTGRAASATVEAAEPSTLLVAPRELLQRLTVEDPRAAIALLRVVNRTLAQRVLAATDRLQEAQARYQVMSIAPASLAPMTEPRAKPERSLLARLYSVLMGTSKATDASEH